MSASANGETGMLAAAVLTQLELVPEADDLDAVSAERSGSDSSSAADEAGASISQMVGGMKRALYGTPDAPPDRAMASQAASEILNSTVLDVLLRKLRVLPFDCRRDTTQVFAAILRKEPAAVEWLLPSTTTTASSSSSSSSSSDNVCVISAASSSSSSTAGSVAGDRGGRQTALIGLLEGCAAPETALHCGAMLREAIRHEPLARWLLEEPLTFQILCRCLESAHFDVASDAFATARELLTRHRALVAAFLDTRHEAFFAQYGRLIRSPSYVTKRQSLKLLGELLLDRANFATMTRFIASADHLKAVMGLLRDPSPSIQYEAFHCFKIFVANPRKDGQVLDLLQRNRTRLLAFLEPFLAAREAQDENFRGEKAFLIEEIQKLATTPMGTIRTGDGVATGPGAGGTQGGAAEAPAPPSEPNVPGSGRT